MVDMNLQYFGGRGSGGGKGGAGGGGAQNANEKAIMSAAEKTFATGTYVSEDGDEYVVEYVRQKGGIIQQTIDGHNYGGSIVVEASTVGDTKKYIARDPSNATRFTNSASEAAKFAFGKPSDEGWKRKK